MPRVKKANVNPTDAAERLGISVNVLRRRIRGGEYSEFAAGSYLNENGVLHCAINRAQFEHYCEEHHL